MERKDVYKLIDGERNYQDHKDQREIESDKVHSVADWIIYMEYQIEQAKLHIYKLDQSAALESVRKITALGVACMENNRTKPR